jgi:hypothetical protein
MIRIAMGSIAAVLLGIFAASPAATAQTSPPVKGMASTVGLYVYPKNKQNATQQLTDESQCYSNAKTQTGYNPDATTTAPNSAKTADAKSGDKPVAQGAMRGAVISGATGGDPAAGARRGAIIGSIKAKRQEKEQTEQQNKAAAAKTTQQQSLDNFKRSMSSCLDARGYSVK